MKSMILLLAAALAVPAAAQTQTLNGAGATFPFPIYSKWFDEFNKEFPEYRINYQAIGSGGGIRQTMAKTVDFGATDGPMTDKMMYKVDGEIHHIPTVLGAVVPIYNLKDVDDLKLDAETLSGIFLGEIRTWSDPKIAALNPGVDLPGAPITVVRRADGSGTTYCFTDYLSTVNKTWSKKVGRATAVRWPTGIGAKGNQGVSQMVEQTPNSIGYTELIYAKQTGITFAALKNKAGKFVTGTVENVTAAAASVKKMPKDYRVSIVDADGENAYPISTYTWLLVYAKNSPEKAKVLNKFLTWMLEKGQGFAPKLGYAPLPADVKAMVEKTVSSLNGG